MISGNSRTGVSNTDDFLCRLLKSCIQLGGTPDIQVLMDMTPVDYVSRAIYHLSRRPDFVGRAFHVMQPEVIYWNTLMDWIRDYGYPLKPIPYSVWQALLDGGGNPGEAPALSMLSPLLGRVPCDGKLSFPDLRIECRLAQEGLAGTSIVCPPMDGKLFGAYFDYFVRSGFLPPPKRTSPPTPSLSRNHQGALGLVSRPCPNAP
jgi:hypothetical protein